MSETLHFIEHIHDTGYGIQIKFTCKGDRTSPCHQYPPAELEMERWGEADKHLFVPHDECWIQDWMTKCDCGEICGPDDEPVRGGPEPITITFEECVQWEYADRREDQSNE